MPTTNARPFGDIPGYGILRTPRTAGEIQKDPIAFLQKVQKEHGDIVRMQIGPVRVVFINNPDYIQQVLKTNHSKYIKSVNYRKVRAVVGHGLINSEGKFWLKQRRLIQPSFQPKNIQKFISDFNDETNKCVQSWKDSPEQSPEVEMHSAMMALTFRIIGQALCSMSVEDYVQDMSDSMDVALSEIMRRLYNPLRLPDFIPTKRNRDFRKSRETLNSVVDGIIRTRRESGELHGDMLDSLLAARDEETNEGMDDMQLRDEVLTMILAGHETTANAMTWTLHLLAQHPEAQERLQAEIKEVLGERDPEMTDLPKMPYTRMVIEESLRMFPPAWEIEREALEDDVIGGYRIPAGTTVAMSQYILHRDPKHWDKPDEFIPERFAPGKGEDRHKFAYIPFGAGPRVCIGNHFAMAESSIILIGIIRHFSLESLKGGELKGEAVLTLRPLGGLPMRLSRLS